MLVLPKMGLVKWENINDNFSHEQLASNFQLLDEHDHTSGKGAKIPFGGLAEQSVGSAELRSGVITEVSEQVKGKIGFRYFTPKIITTEQEIATGSYALLATPDEIPNIVVPSNNCLLEVGYYAQWTAGSTGTGVLGGMFLNEEPVRSGNGFVAAEANNAAFKDLTTQGGGLIQGGAAETVATTGQIIGSNATEQKGGTLKIFVNAGTYKLTMRFKKATGTGSKVKNRRLYAILYGV